jgi:lipoprotein LprA
MTVWFSEAEPHYLVQAQIEPVPGTKIVMTQSDFGKQVTATKPI